MNSQTRHLLATIAYRFDKASVGLPAGFSQYAPIPGSRTALQLLNQSINVLSYAESVLSEMEEITWITDNWEEGRVQFHFVLDKLDDFLEENPVDKPIMERLIQGPLSEVLCTIGQLTLMRHLHGAPVPKENYMRASIRIPTKSLSTLSS